MSGRRSLLVWMKARQKSTRNWRIQLLAYLVKLEYSNPLLRSPLTTSAPAGVASGMFWREKRCDGFLTFTEGFKCVSGADNLGLRA